jgi:hypothetical protein
MCGKWPRGHAAILKMMEENSVSTIKATGPRIVRENARFQQCKSDMSAIHCNEPLWLSMWDLDGVSPMNAPAPRKPHRRHWVQRVIMRDGGTMEEWVCPCAATGGPGRPWAYIDRVPRLQGARFAFRGRR